MHIKTEKGRDYICRSLSSIDVRGDVTTPKKRLFLYGGYSERDRITPEQNDT